jgi:hypothetical protein
MFDHWDETIQTGNDTEYALMILVLCVGVLYTLTRVVSRFLLLKSAADFIFNWDAHRPFPQGERSSFFVIPIPLISLSLALRI